KCQHKVLQAAGISQAQQTAHSPLRDVRQKQAHHDKQQKPLVMGEPVGFIPAGGNHSASLLIRPHQLHSVDLVPSLNQVGRQHHFHVVGLVGGLRERQHKVV